MSNSSNTVSNAADEVRAVSEKLASLRARLSDDAIARIVEKFFEDRDKRYAYHKAYNTRQRMKARLLDKAVREGRITLE